MKFYGGFGSKIETILVEIDRKSASICVEVNIVFDGFSGHVKEVWIWLKDIIQFKDSIIKLINGEINLAELSSLSPEDFHLQVMSYNNISQIFIIKCRITKLDLESQQLNTTLQTGLCVGRESLTNAILELESLIESTKSL